VNDDGGNYAEVKLVQKDVGDIVATLGAEADATWIYKSWEYFALLHAGKEANYFALTDYGERYNFAAPAVSATKRLTEDEPSALREFLAASERGFVEAANDPEFGAAVMGKYTDFDAALLLASQKYISPLYLDGEGRWGRIDDDRWNPLADWIVEEGLLSARDERDFTREFFE
jgi:ABC-type nitrate/sulfonate/bicarbonate transport system substrate-binding protein